MSFILHSNVHRFYQIVVENIREHHVSNIFRSNFFFLSSTLLCTFLSCFETSAACSYARNSFHFPLLLAAAGVPAHKVSGRRPCRFCVPGNVCRDISSTVSTCAMVFSLGVAHTEVYLLVVFVLPNRSLSSKVGERFRKAPR